MQDIKDFLGVEERNHGKEEMRARTILVYALGSLDPIHEARWKQNFRVVIYSTTNESPRTSDCHGEEFGKGTL